jgi:hypothetical protein
MSWDDVRHQALVDGCLPRPNDGLSYSRMLAYRGLDLPLLDTEAVDLDLVIAATKKLDVTIRPIARHVTGLVQVCPRDVAEGVRNKPLGGEVRAEVAIARLLILL